MSIKLSNVEELNKWGHKNISFIQERDMNFTLIPVLFLLNGVSSCGAYKQQGCLMDDNCGWCEELEICIPYDACVNNTECPRSY